MASQTNSSGVIPQLAAFAAFRRGVQPLPELEHAIPIAPFRTPRHPSLQLEASPGLAQASPSLNQASPSSNQLGRSPAASRYNGLSLVTAPVRTVSHADAFRMLPVKAADLGSAWKVALVIAACSSAIAALIYLV